jgi:hypothetical protein
LIQGTFDPDHLLEGTLGRREDFFCVDVSSGWHFLIRESPAKTQTRHLPKRLLFGNPGPRSKNLEGQYRHLGVAGLLAAN